MGLIIVLDILEGGVEPIIVILGFPLLNQHHLFDSWDQVELIDVLAELTRLDLGIIQEVLNNESENIGWGLLDLPPRFELDHQMVLLTNELDWVDLTLLEVINEVSHLTVNSLLLDVLGDNRVQGVSHLMGDTRIYHWQDDVVSLFHVIQDFLGNVDKLEHDFLLVLAHELGKLDLEEDLNSILLFLVKFKDNVAQLIGSELFDDVNKAILKLY